MGMAHEDGTILAAELYPVAEACGQTAEQVRSCLRRLTTERLVVRHGSGNNARFEATEQGMAALGANIERTRLAYAQDAAGRGWDRQWRLVGFAVPERRRSARDTFRDRLTQLGGAAVQGGLYASPHPWHKDVRDEADRLEVTDLVTYAVTDDLQIGSERDPRELARRLWPVDDLAERYRAFVGQYEAVPDFLRAMKQRKERLADAEFLPGALTMAVAFQAVFGDDPLLPPELLPRPWPGRTARDLLVTSRRLSLQVLQRPGRPALFHLF
ncbi:MAG: phenylacetic acid degradation operon negative regulatory protein, partial [Acidimicrobiaceae bacterium]|nr:phenylacetic acid degradation operon negative regulatory protein [Acidimicrobiaceae bacterium]